jgi:hypothetical protein
LFKRCDIGVEHLNAEEGGVIMSVVDDLREQINTGRIIFDPPAGTSQRLRKELLGENSGTKVTESLQRLVLEVSRLSKIRISDILRPGSSSHHARGRAFDVGNEEIGASLLPGIATDAKVAALNIDEIIFDARIAGQADRNKWNYDRGLRHDYSSSTLARHDNHIHFAVKSE